LEDETSASRRPHSFKWLGDIAMLTQPPRITAAFPRHPSAPTMAVARPEGAAITLAILQVNIPFARLTIHAAESCFAIARPVNIYIRAVVTRKPFVAFALSMSTTAAISMACGGGMAHLLAFARVRVPGHMCGMTRSYVWRDSFICVT